jgi:hypothetical protein
MLRFTIRDVLWLMALVGLCAALLLQRIKMDRIQGHAERLRHALRVARDSYEPSKTYLDRVPFVEQVDWTLADEPISK